MSDVIRSTRLFNSSTNLLAEASHRNQTYLGVPGVTENKLLQIGLSLLPLIPRGGTHMDATYQ